MYINTNSLSISTVPNTENPSTIGNNTAIWGTHSRRIFLAGLPKKIRVIYLRWRKVVWKYTTLEIWIPPLEVFERTIQFHPVVAGTISKSWFYAKGTTGTCTFRALLKIVISELVSASGRFRWISNQDGQRNPGVITVMMASHSIADSHPSTAQHSPLAILSDVALILSNIKSRTPRMESC